MAFARDISSTFSNRPLFFKNVDKRFFACDKDLESLINRLENDSLLAGEWFRNNNMKLNKDKCHLKENFTLIYEI